ARSAVEWQEKGSSLVAAETLVSAEETRLTEHIAGLQKSVDERQAALKAKQSELTELQAKKTANSLLPEIEKRVSDAKWVAKTTIVKNNLTAVLRSLTEAAKDASEELLNKDFGRRFEDECKLLRAPNVTLNFPGRQGQVTRRSVGESNAVFLSGYGQRSGNRQRSGSRSRENRISGILKSNCPGCTRIKAKPQHHSLSANHLFLGSSDRLRSRLRHHPIKERHDNRGAMFCPKCKVEY